MKRQHFLMEKIAVLTSGGDSPGMNAVLHFVVRAATLLGLETYFVKDGFKGLVAGELVKAYPKDTVQYLNRAGTFIGSQRFPEFAQKEVRAKAIEKLRNLGIEALIVIGGDGSYRGAQALHEMGIATVGIPATIDNDIVSSDFSIGFDSALATVSKAIESLEATAASHKRCILVEVMGRLCGDLALFGGIATGAEVIINSDSNLSEEEVVNSVTELLNSGKYSKLVVVIAELIYPSIQDLAQKIEVKSGVTTRAVVLAHTQRGAVPTPLERVRAFLFATKSVELLKKGYHGLALGLRGNKVEVTSLPEALSQISENKKDLVKWVNKINQV